MVMSAQQRQVVDVGRPSSAAFPMGDVVRFTHRRPCTTDDAAAIAHDQASPLTVGGEPTPATVPERVAIGGEHEAEEISATRKTLDLGLRERRPRWCPRLLGGDDHQHLIAHRWAAGRPVGVDPATEHGDQDVGPALGGRAPLAGDASPSVSLEERVGGTIERCLDLGPADRVELGMEDPHAVVAFEDRARPCRILTPAPGFDHRGSLVLTDERPHVSRQQVGRTGLGLSQQIGPVERFGRRGRERAAEHVDVFAGGATRRQRIAEAGHVGERLGPLSAPAGVDVILVASDGQTLRMPVDSISTQGRGAGGVTGMKLKGDATVVGAGPVIGDGVVLTITSASAAKATPYEEFEVKGRGGQGVRVAKLGSGERVTLAWLGTLGSIGGAGDLLAQMADDDDPKKLDPNPVPFSIEPSKRDLVPISTERQVMVLGPSRW